MKTDPDFHPEAAEWLDGTATDGSRRLLNELLHEPGAVEEFAALSRTDALLRASGKSESERRAALASVLAGKAWPLRALSLFRRPPVPWAAAAAALIAIGAWALWPAPAPEPEPEPVIAKTAPSPQLMPVANSGRHSSPGDDAAPLPPADQSVELWLRRYYVKPLPLTGDLPSAAAALAAAITLEDGSHLKVDTQTSGDAPVHLNLPVSLPAWTLVDIMATQTGTDVQLSGKSLVFREARKPSPREGSISRNTTKAALEGFIGNSLNVKNEGEECPILDSFTKEYLGGSLRFAFVSGKGDAFSYTGTPRDVHVLSKALSAPALPLWNASLTTKVVEMPAGLLPELLSAQGIPSGNGALRYMNDEQFQLLMRALSQHQGVDLLTAPSMVTRLNQKAVMRTKGEEENSTGVVCEFVVLVNSSNELSIDAALKVDVWDDATKQLSTQDRNSHYTVASGTTVALGGFSAKDGREVIFFVTGTLVDPLEKNPPEPAEPAQAAPPADALPYGIPVPDKPGFLYSPYAQDKGFVDVTGLPKHTRVKCPYSNKPFRVP